MAVLAVKLLQLRQNARAGGQGREESGTGELKLSMTRQHRQLAGSTYKEFFPVSSRPASSSAALCLDESVP
jgi:hypothetical protein